VNKVSKEEPDTQIEEGKDVVGTNRQLNRVVMEVVCSKGTKNTAISSKSGTKIENPKEIPT
jgi:hypothetical protein